MSLVGAQWSSGMAGPQRRRKVFTLHTLPERDPDEQFPNGVVKVAGFALHAGVATKAHERAKLERLRRVLGQQLWLRNPLT
jgi:hypothetical protein